ncbi:MAG: hypothetical protein KDJ49_08940 [Alphaproteobacteria bacterium]|nr:hypothetical protein [Alphaproteobacteria bacterium]USO08079.1 MAG: hypothetical protein H6866_02340 [Rhodospirillales bacterium]
MSKLAVIVWCVAAPTLMGIFVLTVLVVPSLAAKENMMILPAAIAGAVVAAPISYYIARHIRALTSS